MKNRDALAIISMVYFLTAGFAFGQNLPPKLRPSGVSIEAPVLRAGSSLAVLPPLLRPGRARTSRVETAQVVATSGQGTLCRDRSIMGQELRPITGTNPSCQVARPIRVNSINGIVFEPAAIMNCATATATKDWLEKSAIPAWGRLGGGLSKLDVSTAFSCDATSGAAAHQQGSAIDISRFHLKNGLQISVEQGWRDPVAGKVLRDIHQGGCKSFKTALGPDAGVQTRDHLHFDTANGRGKCR